MLKWLKCAFTARFNSSDLSERVHADDQVAKLRFPASTAHAVFIETIWRMVLQQIRKHSTLKHGYKRSAMNRCSIVAMRLPEFMILKYTRKP